MRQATPLLCARRGNDSLNHPGAMRTLASSKPSRVARVRASAGELSFPRPFLHAVLSMLTAFCVAIGGGIPRNESQS